MLKEQKELEAMVGKYGLFAVLDVLSGVVGHKVEEVEAAGESIVLLNEWIRASSAIDHAASRVLDLDLQEVAS